MVYPLKSTCASSSKTSARKKNSNATQVRHARKNSPQRVKAKPKTGTLRSLLTGDSHLVSVLRWIE
jgi:hypothetical protein